MTVLLMAMFLGSPAIPSTCQADRNGFCTDRLVFYPLIYAEPNPVVRINAAIGDTVSVELPAYATPLRDPPLGNASIFSFQRADRKSPQDSDLLTFWAKVPDGAGDIDVADLVGETTNVHLYLDGITVTLELRVGQRGQSTQRVIFSFPERAQETDWLKRRMAEERAVLYKEVEEKKAAKVRDIDRQAKAYVAGEMMKGAFCAELRERQMVGLLILRAHRICRVGDDVYLHFAVKNRARDIFRLGNIKLEGEGGDSAEALPSVDFTYDTLHVLLGYDGETSGVATFRADKDTASKRYTLHVSEQGGKKREVSLPGLGF